MAIPTDRADRDAPDLVRVPSNVVNAASPDEARNEKENGQKVASETESNENDAPEFKEGGYGW